MASIALEFVPPDMQELVTLDIFESPVATGPFRLIESVSAIGVFPDYISGYTSDKADSLVDWFLIQWVDAKGAKSKQSTPIKGNTQLLIGKVVDRVTQRDPQLKHSIVIQESESALESYFGVDPYTIDPANLAANRKYQTINGLTYLVMARCILAQMIQSNAIASATMGLVSFKSSTTTAKDVQELVDLAYKELGIGGSVVIDMERICKHYGGTSWPQILLNFDQEFRMIRWVPRQVEIMSRR